jgi:L-ascorbate metabolism protein UlaG (beta-lactamase superfamily)
MIRRETDMAGLRRIAPVLLIITGLAACLPKGLEKKNRPPGPNGVSVRFLGVGGFLIRKGPDVLMTAPLYTSPPVPALLAGILDGDPNGPRTFYARHRIEADANDIRAILVGHAHYDHLMDVPFFMDRAPQATVYGSTSTRNVLAGYGARYADRVDALNEPGRDRVDSRNCRGPIPGLDCGQWAGTAGEWVDVPGAAGRMRVRAFCSAHPEQVLKEIHFWPGCVAQPLTAPPTDPNVMREGEVLAFLVDFLEQGRVTFRLYYQDAPVQEPVGWVPADVLADRAVDVALLNGGNFDAVQGAERVVGNLRARHAVIHHWENFFDPTHNDETPITDINTFRAKVIHAMGGDSNRVRLLKPGVTIGF